MKMEGTYYESFPFTWIRFDDELGLEAVIRPHDRKGFQCILEDTNADAVIGVYYSNNFERLKRKAESFITGNIER